MFIITQFGEYFNERIIINVGPASENSALTPPIMKIKVFIFLDKLDYSDHICNFSSKKLWNFPYWDFHNSFRIKKMFLQENYKDDQNGLIHPEN